MTKYVFKNSAGALVETPTGFVERMTIDVDGDAIENPIYESHKRGTNWCAVMTGKNAANMERSFLAQRGMIIDVSSVEVGAALEIAGDYTSSGGNKQRNRITGVVVLKSENEFVIDVYASVAKAISATNKGIRSVEIEEADKASEDAMGLAALVAPEALDEFEAALAAYIAAGKGVTDIHAEVMDAIAARKAAA
jgi:hypothetical protein